MTYVLCDEAGVVQKNWNRKQVCGEIITTERGNLIVIGSKTIGNIVYLFCRKR